LLLLKLLRLFRLKGRNTFFRNNNVVLFFLYLLCDLGELSFITMEKFIDFLDNFLFIILKSTLITISSWFLNCIAFNSSIFCFSWKMISPAYWILFLTACLNSLSSCWDPILICLFIGAYLFAQIFHQAVQSVELLCYGVLHWLQLRLVGQ
jgi:hypothetical protein